MDASDRRGAAGLRNHGGARSVGHTHQSSGEVQIVARFRLVDDAAELSSEITAWDPGTNDRFWPIADGRIFYFPGV